MYRVTTKQVMGLKALTHLIALGWLILTFYLAFTDQMGADPVQALIHFTGMGAFNLLLISLVISPLAKYSKQGALLRIRRLIGLYAFFYAFCHFLSYLLFDLQAEWVLLLSEIVKRPYITVGFSAFVILTLLAATSTQRIQRALGRRWQHLHNWVYLALPLVGLHFIWSVKSGLVEPIIYLTIALTLLFLRKRKLLKHVTK